MKRFPRLQLLNQKSTKKKIKVILTACGLRNICIMENDNVDFYIRRAPQVLNNRDDICQSYFRNTRLSLSNKYAYSLVAKAVVTLKCSSVVMWVLDLISPKEFPHPQRRQKRQPI